MTQRLELNLPYRALMFDGLRTAELKECAFDRTALKPDEVFGRTLVTLISPGTELNAAFDKPGREPGLSGYAAVWRVEQVGSAVEDMKPGDVVYSMGPHATHQRVARGDVIAVPEALSPRIAVMARLAAVSWTTLVTTRARPADRVLVVGLGIVGNLAAQIFHAAGYTVVGVDPVASRRELATRVGLADVRASVGAITDEVALAIDCSGHEQAVLEAIKVVRPGGEAVLIGVPWKRRSDLPAFDLLHAIFHRYVNVRTGWEWELPARPGKFQPHSIQGNVSSAVRWLAEGRLNVAPLTINMSPANAREAYLGLLEQRQDGLTVVFDWDAA